jgi:ATP-dependent Lon protease
VELEVNEIGVATGLAWTSVGGEILHVETTTMKGKGNLTLTGHLGDVMKESAQAAVSYARSKSRDLNLDPDFYEKLDVHVHVPAGAIPKDGPSAGVTMATSLISALTRIPVRKDVAMTGEITLRGRVLPIGGLKEKTLAALRAGIRNVVIPDQNQKDLEDIPPYIRRKVNYVFAKNMDEILKMALVPEKAEASSAAPKQEPGEKKERPENVSMPMPV